MTVGGNIHSGGRFIYALSGGLGSLEALESI